MKILRRLLCIFVALILVLSCNIYSLAKSNSKEMIDKAHVLSQEQIDKLSYEFEQIRETHNLDVRGLIVDGTDGEDIMDFADNYYEEKGFGLGKNHDGVMLVLDLDSRQWWITTEGYGINVVTDYGISTVGDRILSYLSNGNYYKAFSTYGKSMREFATAIENGNPFDITSVDEDNENWDSKPYDEEKLPYNIATGALAAIVLGSISGFTSSSYHKRKLKSVNRKYTAYNYIRKGSLNVDEARDIFLYSNVIRHRKPDPDDDDVFSGGGGSTVHTSSSGRTHGGGGGSF